MPKMNHRLLPSLIVALAAFPSAGYPQEKRDAAANVCNRVAKAAEEGARLRESGLAKEAAGKELSKTFSEYEVGMGGTAAFTYTALREFAMADFVESYCRLVVGKNGQLSVFDKLMIKTQYDRSVECSKSGHTQKEAFLECWNEQHRRAKEAAPTSR